MAPDERRASLLEQAERIIANEGQATLTMERLAVRAGVSNGLVYKYFRNRADLLMCILEHYWRQHDMELAGAARSASTLDEALRQAFRVYIKIRQQYPAFWLLHSQTCVEPDVERRRLARRADRAVKWGRWFAANYPISEETGKLAASMVFGAVEAGLWHFITYGYGENSKDIEDLGVAYLIGGMSRFCDVIGEERPAVGEPLPLRFDEAE